MEVSIITELWKLAQGGGALFILFMTNVLLWFKIDKKDDKIYELLLLIEKVTHNQEQTNQMVQNLTTILIQGVSYKNEK